MEWPSNPYFAAFVLLFMARNIAEFFVKPRSDSSPGNPKRGGISLALLTLPYLVSGVTVATLLFKHPAANGLWFVAGVILYLGGFAGRILSLRTLGGNYNLFLDPPTSAKLVTTGVYSIIRHPLYAFYLVELAAFVCLRNNPVSWICLILVGMATAHRIRREDAILEERFGPAAVAYKQRTKRIVPFIY